MCNNAAVSISLGRRDPGTSYLTDYKVNVTILVTRAIKTVSSSFKRGRRSGNCLIIMSTLFIDDKQTTNIQFLFRNRDLHTIFKIDRNRRTYSVVLFDRQSSSSEDEIKSLKTAQCLFLCLFIFFRLQKCHTNAQNPI